MSGFYYIFLIFIFSAKMAGLYDGQPAFYTCVLLGLVFYLIKWLSTKHTVFECLIMLFLFIVTGITYIYSGEKGMLLYIFMLTGMKNIRSRDAFKTLLIDGVIVSVIMIMTRLLGIIIDDYHITEKFGGIALIRQYFGQPNANVTHTIYFILVALALYFYKARNIQNTILFSVFLMFLNVYLFLYTLSLTGVMSVAFLLVLNFIFEFKKNSFSKTEKIIIELIYGFVVAGSIVISLIVKGRAFEILDKIFNYRILYSYYYLTTEKITLFGSRFAEAPNGNYYLDNSFLYLFLQLGVITFIATIVLMFMALVYILDKGDKKALVIFASFTFIGLSDPFLFNTAFKNVIFIIAGEALFSKTSALRFGNILDREIYIIKDSTILKSINAKIIYVLNKLIGIFRSIEDAFNRNAGITVAVFAIVPSFCGALFYMFPVLYDHVLLSRGSRLLYVVVVKMMLYELDKRLIWVRSGVSEGIVIILVVICIKTLIGNRKKGVKLYGKA